MEQMLVQNAVKKVQLLPAVNDEHGGVIIELEKPMDPNVFHNMLRSSLRQWKLQGKKGVWITLPIELVNLVETAVKEGFWYHHAEPHYLMLVYWIPKTENTIPENASHRVGIGAIVLNEKREIDTEFLEVLAFSQMHKSFFGKSDLFFICMMRPLMFNLQKQDLEIEAAQWMSLEEYAAQPFVLKHGIMRYIKDLCFAKAGGSYPGFTPVPIKSCFGDPMSYLYFNGDGLVQETSAIHL
ncbi:nudix hydrolase 2-like isoform X2 [Solanum dulcamara]|uniref:nudix hydrolase 2-like isoform X2 n=1 Tax=Solanum dulcamara TaxID=45834 RepID=UPI0024868A91|nr:nudix hydrolase 2-like isoform X2 [Solanum dulcamara]